MNNSQNYHNHQQQLHHQQQQLLHHHNNNLLLNGQISGTTGVDDSSLHSTISSSMHHQVGGGGVGGLGGVDDTNLYKQQTTRSNRVQYNHLDNSQQKMYHQDPNQHYQPHYQDYEHYPPQGGLYGSTTGSMDHGQMVGGIPEQYLNEYSSNDNNDHHNSGSPNPGAQMQTSQMHAMIPSSAYLKATSQYDEMPDYRITPSPGGIPSNHRYVSGAGGTGPADDSALLYGYISTPTNPTYASRPYLYNDNIPPGAGLVSLPPGSHGHGTLTRIMDDEQELQKHMSQLSMHSHGQRQLQSAQGHHPGDGFVGMDDQNQMRWRDPNLSEVIGFLDNPNNVVKANAAAYLQHLCYMDDPNKQRTRSLGGIPPLISLLSNDDPQVHRNACGALRNLSYGRQNDENKRAIKNAGGILALINLLRRTNDSDVKELITGIVWNMSSCEDIKRSIIDDGLIVIVSNVIKPHSGWDTISPGETCWSTVFRNASGVLRNVSSAGEYARTKLRECDGLVDCLLYVVRAAIEKSNIGNKIVENAVCILRNLSYRCQEVEDPNYDKHPIPTNQQQTRSSSPKGENLGCFGAGRKKNKDNSSNSSQDQKDFSNAIGNGSASGGLGARNNSTKSFEMLWQPEVVQSYLTLLQSCSNPETLEAAAGAIQNLAACYWQPSIEIRAAVRKEKGLPILVELLRMEVDRVVCAVATALRNLAIDQRNKELIGKYAMRDLVQKLPSGNPQHDQGTSDDTIAAVLATINEVIKKNAEFSRSLLEAGGVDRLMTITRQRQKYTPCVLKFASQVLFTMWQHTELRDTYKKQGWKEADFVTKTIAARNAAQNSPNNVNNTLNRPMASQGRTRYEDKTLKKNATGNSTNAGSNQHHGNNMSIAQGGVGSEPLYQKPL